MIEVEQTGSWAACSRNELSRGSVEWFPTLDELARRIDHGHALDYFVPTPFETKVPRFVDVKKFELLAKMTNVVRVDLDPPPSLTREDRVSFLEENLLFLTSVTGEPTAVLDSGRGRSGLLQARGSRVEGARHEISTRMLSLVSGSKDRQSYSPSQWARLPGSVNEKTDEIAAVVAGSDQAARPSSPAGASHGASASTPERAVAPHRPSA